MPGVCRLRILRPILSQQVGVHCCSRRGRKTPESLARLGALLSVASSLSALQPQPGPSLLTSDLLFCFKKRLKAAEAESKLKQVYIPN